MEEIFALPAERSERRRPPVPRAAPWLVVPYGKDEKDQAFFNICEPKNRTCRKCIPELTRKSFWQSPSHQGWLVILCDNGDDSTPNCKFGDCFLWNPVSLKTIQLPSLLDWLLLDHYVIRGCVLSSPPTSNPDGDDDDDSTVFFLFSPKDDTQGCVLVFCRPGEDKQWRKQELPADIVDKGCNQPLFYFKGKLYVMGREDSHIEIEEKIGSYDDVPQIFSIRSFNLSDDTFFPSRGGLVLSRKNYYVESCGDIFKVVEYHNVRGWNKVVISVQVLRLNFSLLAWEEVKSLGDHVLFLGCNTTASCSAAELGLTRGCLFYTLSKDQTLYQLDLENNDTTFYLPCLKLPTPWSTQEWMMIPTTVRVSDGRRRRIEDMLCKAEEEDNIIEAEENKTSLSNDEEEEDQGKIHNGGELETWGLRRNVIFDLVANYLNPVDYIHFRAVCKENQLIIPSGNWRTSCTGIRQTTSLFPFLLSSKSKDTIYSFVDPMHNNEKYLMNLSDLLIGATIRFSKGGWLLMSKGMRTLFFYNPFTRAMIQLPDIPDYLAYVFTGISFSSLPTSSDCVVFGITGLVSGVFICFIARGDNSWTFIDQNPNLPRNVEFMPCVNSPVLYNGAFYCLDYNGTLGVFNIKDRIWKVLPKPQARFHPIHPSYLMECEGELLAVDVGHVGKSVGVFRLDFFKMVWVKVESLGKHMLFISDTSSFSAVAPHNRMANKIYFPRLHGEQILFYSLDTARYCCIGNRHSAKDFYYTNGNSNCSWINANWSQTTVQELDWLTV